MSVLIFLGGAYSHRAPAWLGGHGQSIITNEHHMRLRPGTCGLTSNVEVWRKLHAELLLLSLPRTKCVMREYTEIGDRKTGSIVVVVFFVRALESVLGQRPRATVPMTASQIKPSRNGMTMMFAPRIVYGNGITSALTGIGPGRIMCDPANSAKQQVVAVSPVQCACATLCVLRAHTSINTHMCWLGFSSQTMEGKESKNDAKQMRRRRRRL